MGGDRRSGWGVGKEERGERREERGKRKDEREKKNKNK